ncbi:karyopherin (importin) beta 3 [Anaeramoeba flamelloides]|uniref:Karyopherin (Importin) beta 3 n=1 Tax=Anaeramoeba flamelloides TaxID=1746091 RepID=A0ABQ8Y8R1_9EUKA|nr:karyopherin (importin) beta 3 [Anaeramoeba flamelloides]
MSQETYQEFSDVLVDILNPNNNIRNQAEPKFFTLQENDPDLCAQCLIGMLSFSQHSEVRVLSMVLLRQMLFSVSPPYWRQFRKEIKQLIKEELLECLNNEKQSYVRRKICDTIILAGSLLITDDSWPELLNLVLTYSTSNIDEEAELGLYLFEGLSVMVGKELSEGYTEFSVMLSKALDSKRKLSVRVCAAKAVCQYVVHLPEKILMDFSELIPDILNILTGLLDEGDFDLMTNLVTQMIEISEVSPKYYSKHLDEIKEGFFQLATMSSEEIEDSVKQSALKFLSSLIEHAPRLAHECENFIDKTIQASLHLLMDLSDPPKNSRLSLGEWMKSIQNEFINSNSYLAETALTRISREIGKDLMLKFMNEYVPSFLSSEESWQKRYAGIRCLSSICEGCGYSLSEDVGEIINLLIPFFSDEHPRVRHAVVLSISDITRDFPGVIQEGFSEEIIPQLVSIISDESIEFLCSETLGTLTVFLQGIEPEELENKIKNLLETTIGAFNRGNPETQEQAITTISAIALKSDPETLALYYDDLLSLTFELMQKGETKNEKLIRAQAFECATIIGSGVNAELFKNDAHQIMEFSIKLHQEGLSTDDPLLDKIFYAWARISTSLTFEFEKYLGYIIPILLELASTQSKNSQNIKQTEDKEQQQQSKTPLSFTDGWDETVYEVRSHAINNLFIISGSLKGHFHHWCESCLKFASLNAKCFLNDELRSFSTQLLGTLVNSIVHAVENGIAKNIDRDYVIKFGEDVLKNLIKFLTLERQPQLIANLFETISEVFDTLKTLTDSKTIVKFLQPVPVALEASDKRIANEINTFSKNQDLLLFSESIFNNIGNDENENENFNSSISALQIYEHLQYKGQDVENELLVKKMIIAACTSLGKYYPQLYESFFNQSLLKWVTSIAQDEKSLPDQKYAAIGFLNVYIRFVVPISNNQEQLFQKIWDQFSQFIFRPITLEDYDLKDISASAIIWCAKNGSKVFQEFAEQAITVLIESSPDEGILGHSSYVAAIGSIIENHSDSLQELKQIIQLWVKMFPIHTEGDIATLCYQILTKIYQEIDTHDFVRLISQILNEDYVTQDLKNDIKNALTDIQNQLGKNQFEELIIKIGDKQLLLNFASFF